MATDPVIPKSTPELQRATACVVLCLVTLLAAPFASAQTVRHHREAIEDPNQPPELRDAEAAIEQNDYAKAEPLLQKVVQSDPKNYLAWFDLGFLYNAMGQPDDSIHAYQQSVDAKPDVFESQLNLGLMLAKYNKPGADVPLRAATKLKPSDHPEEGVARAWTALGHVLESKSPDEALEAFRQASALQPKNPEPHLSAGAILEKENRFSDAEQEYKQALAIDPKASDALVGLANIYMRGRRFPEAEEYLKKVIDQRPDDPVAHQQLARVLAADGKYEDAVAQFEVAQKLAPGDASVQRDYADVLYNAGHFTDAERLYRSLLALTPNSAELHHSLAQSLLRQKKFPEAVQELFTTVKLKPDWGEAYGELAIAANENHDYPLTIKALDVRAKFLPELPATYFLRATAYDHLHDFKQASANYHLFLQVANGKYPDQEWQAQHRLIAIEPKKK
jgi:tetratricopeptide (TPR) repeat protein